MSQFNLYLDADAMRGRLVAALRSRGVNSITSLDAGLTEGSDEEQLAFATAHECVLYTFNICDFQRLHTEWIGAGEITPA